MLRVAVLALVGCLLFGCDKGAVEAGDLEAAREAAHERNWEDTARLVQRFLHEENDPDQRWDAWNLLVSASEHMGETRWTIEYLEGMLQEYSAQPARCAQILRRLAPALEKNRQWDRAASAWLHLLDLEEFSPDEAARLYQHMGLFYLHRQEAALAEDMFAMCVEQAGDSRLLGECRYGLAQACAVSGKDEEALAHIDRLFDLAVGGNWSTLEGDRVEQLSRSELVEPGILGQALFLRGDILDQNGRPDEAREAFLAALPLHANPPAVQKRLDYLNKDPLLPRLP